ncbi:MAG: proline--tRNA ligase [Polyangiaceae bacterium]|nr:proline--tRNA ligase [Polyangiaceae bacterium]
MRYSQLLIPTLKEVPAEAIVVSHQLLFRAGFIRKLAAGIYNLLPLALRTVHKIERIIREELGRAGAQELLMPAVQPSELWEESGRWQKYGAELLRFQDRKGAWFCLGPTHEEVITDLVKREVRSYRQLPLNLYQIQSKFRDEIRPRFGLMRGREFLMKDAYSFDATAEGAHKSYHQMYNAYRRIFERCGLDFRAVEADTGNIGGSLSHEFQVLAESGEDEILSCDHCTYAANVEKAELKAREVTAGEPTHAVEKVSTPGQKTIAEVAAFLKAAPSALAKTLLFKADDKIVVVVLRGDHEVNLPKLKALLGGVEPVLASDEVVSKITGAPPGYAGPVGLAGVEVVADNALAGATDLIVGANEADTHLRHVAVGRDFTPSKFADLRLARPGDRCPRCEEGKYVTHRGIEVGHVFYLGTKYSVAMNARFLDDKGEEKPFEMGCYGIGVTRTMAAAIEQNHDADGIKWPIGIAPYHAMVVPLQMKDAKVVETAEKIQADLTAAGLESVLDDREERPGIKFKDADLLGFPFRIVIGQKGLAGGTVELKRRGSAEVLNLSPQDAVAHIQKAVAAELQKSA